MSSLNSASTAPQQAGNAPMCSGSTTCCATTSPSAFISAHDASCDSRTMVENPVRNSELCISCTIPEREAFTTSRSIGSMAISSGLRDDDILPLIDARDLARADEGRAVELFQNRGPVKRRADINAFAPIYRAFHFDCAKAQMPPFAKRGLEALPTGAELRNMHGWHAPYSARAV